MNQVDRTDSPVPVHFPDVLLSSTTDTAMAGPTLGEPFPALEELPNSSVIKPQTFASFSRLPPEIRQLIWDFTFTPRTLHIEVHEGATPALGSGSATQPWILSCRLKRACICFTAFDGLVESPDPIHFYREIRNRHYTERVKNWTITPGMNTPPPPGPVALYVCHESRKLALKHYELAFGGTNCQPDTDTKFADAWQKAGYGEKRIWVNFEIDTIFVALGQTHYLGCPGDILTMLTCYAKEEVKKIKWLAFSKHWSNCRTMNSPPKAWNIQLPKDLKSFTRLKEILIYHIESFNPTYNPEWIGPEIDRNLRDLKEAILVAFEMEKREDPAWTIDLPKIEIRLGYVHGYNRGRGPRY